jgi:WD40 repeat protein
VPPALGRRINEACDRFEAAWRAGAPPRLEDACAGWQGAERAALLRELVPLDADYRRQRGERPAVADYLPRFPELDASCVGPSSGVMTPVTPTAPPGETLLTNGPPGGVGSLGDFEDLEEIARGGMGVVYRARQRRLGRVVALKMILAGQFASPEAVQRFCSEAKNVARLDHPHIVPVHEVGEHNGLPYFSMKYIDGSSLVQRPPTAAREIAGLMAKVARAVHHAHQRGILHRDIKPGNILLDGAGEPYVTDFGLAKHVEEATAHTLSGAVVGTPSYMAPEQARGHSKRLTTAADVYGLGAVLYELLAGRPPFKGETPLETLQDVLTREAVPPSRLRSGMPRDLEVICLTCLRKEPERRYESALALAEDLERWLTGEAIRARAAGRVERTIRWVRRHPAGAALAVVSALAAMALVGVGVGQWYNARLKASKKALEASNAALEAAKTDLQDTNNELADTNGKLKATSNQLQITLEAVRAEKAKARRYFYASQMTLVEQARRDKQDGRVVQLLRTFIPDDPEEEDPRGFEWYHLWREYRGEQSRLRGHKGAVTAVAFSPDDRLIASGSADNSVKLWDAATGKELRSLEGHQACVTGVAFSPDGQSMVTASADRTVRVWEVATGKMMQRLQGHDGPVTCVAYSPDGRSVASGSEDRTLRIWNADTWEVSLEFKEHTRPVRAVAFSPDSSKVASIGQGPKGEFLVWNAYKGGIHLRLPNKPWTCVAFDPDGQHLATGEAGAVERDDNGSPYQVLLKPAVSIWDLNTKQSIQALNGHEDVITQIAFRPDGKQLVSSGADQVVRVWDLATGKEAVKFHEEQAALSVAFSADGARIASGGADHTVKLWAPPGKAMRALSGARGTNVEFSPDGRLMAAGDGIWNAMTGIRVQTVQASGYGRVTWSPEGNQVASGLTVTGVATGATVRLLPGLSAPGSGSTFGAGTAYSPDGKRVASVITDKTVGVWDVATGRLLHEFATLPWCVCVAFSADGQRLAVGSALQHSITPDALRIWDVATGQVCYSPDAFLPGVQAIAFSADGKWLAAAVGDYGSLRNGEVRVWDATTYQQVFALRGHSGCVWCVAFSPDGKRLASGSGDYVSRTASNGAIPPKRRGEVKIWDLQTGQELCTLRENKRPVLGVSFSPDGRRLAAASGGENDMIIWDGTPLASAPQPDRE